jgi:hypothetical protein
MNRGAAVESQVDFTDPAFNAGERRDLVDDLDSDDDNLGDLDFTPRRPGMRSTSSVGVREADPEAPAGFVREQRVAATGNYHVWYDSEGKRFASRNDAWESVGGRPARSRTSVADDDFGNPGGSADVVRLSPVLPVVNTKCLRGGCIVPSVDGAYLGNHKFSGDL